MLRIARAAAVVSALLLIYAVSPAFGWAALVTATVLVFGKRTRVRANSIAA